MHVLDYVVIGAYLLAMVGIGVWFLRRQTDAAAYFVGNRQLGAGHLGLSVVATDVGGGFSIGLGGLGFSMGLAGSWLLFTGLVGAWLTAVLLIPRVKPLGDRHGWTTFPDYLEHRFDRRTRLTAGLVSAVGYAGFVGAQILAGAKLGSVAFEVDTHTAVAVMAVIVIGYTALGGLQAVVATDTIQWGVLLGGLGLVALPLAWSAVGGLDGLRAGLPTGHLSLTNISGKALLTWAVTIIPIWFVGNTLYQRIMAASDEKTARRAWYLAGLLEWPLMAFIGTLLGMIARVLHPEVESELGLPILIREVLPTGFAGVVLAAYFSAIMSTADSCLLASVGNIVRDLWEREAKVPPSSERVLQVSRWLTFGVGAASVLVALVLPKVLDAILLAYGFMVSGLFMPALGGLLWKRVSSLAAFGAMVVGGGLSVILPSLPDTVFPEGWGWLGTDPILAALPASGITLVVLTFLRRDPETESKYEGHVMVPEEPPG